MPEGVSARKLVVETAKHNVISAYGGKEGLQLFERFPRVDAAVIHSELPDMGCDEVAEKVRSRDSGIPIVVLSPNTHTRCSRVVDLTLPSHEPTALLEFLETLVPTAKN